MKKTTNKKSVSKKLLPAVAMLTTSAIMLSTATYAWFTMSREVSVTGIKMTASVPQTLEISLGKVSDDTVVAPTTDTGDWSNTVASNSIYKAIGKLIPASSTTGNTIFYTDGADGQGKTVKNNSVFTDASKNDAGIVGFDLASASGTVAEGYYMDIPVWFRTTSTTDVDLYVKATIADGGSNGTLFTATRVAILDDAKANSAGVISISDAKYYADKVTSKATLVAVNKAGTYVGAADTNTVYGALTACGQTDGATKTGATKVGTVTADDDDADNYGVSLQRTIRIWIEGEDTTCWNAQAGQNFNVDLTFYDGSSLT